VPPSIAVWRSVRLHGDTKTEKSRRTLALPHRAVTALREHAGGRQGPGWRRAAVAGHRLGVHDEPGHAAGRLARPPRLPGPPVEQARQHVLVGVITPRDP